MKQEVLNEKSACHEESKALCGVPIIIMAGGQGIRLYPYTKILPKPLIPIGDIPIMERIIDLFCLYGADEFYITINYKKEIIKSYFAEIEHSYSINFIEENEPLGTAGSISLISKKFVTPVIITNCDIIIDADYKDILEFHRKSKNDMTIVSSLKTIQIPYGVLQADNNGLVKEMEEKPKIFQYVNTGMYVIEPDYLDWIPKNKFYHMTDLAQKMIDEGKTVRIYPISEDSFWDMGEFAEMKKMEERIGLREK